MGQWRKGHISHIHTIILSHSRNWCERGCCRKKARAILEKRADSGGQIPRSEADQETGAEGNMGTQRARQRQTQPVGECKEQAEQEQGAEEEGSKKGEDPGGGQMGRGREGV